MSVRLKGQALFGFVVGLIVLFVGVALMYTIPEYIVSSLNTSIGCKGYGCLAYNSTPEECGDEAINCCTEGCTEWYAEEAKTKADQVRALGYVVIIISVVWMLISVIAGRRQ